MPSRYTAGERELAGTRRERISISPMVGVSIQEAVFRAVYATENASIQMQAHQLAGGGEVEFLSAEESEKSSKGRNVPRAWSLWKHEMTAQP